MLVKDKMTDTPITITSQATIVQALQLMRDNKVRRLPIVDNGKLVGIVTDRDLSEVSPSPATSLSVFELNYLLAKTKIADVIPKNQHIITINDNELIEEAALLMRDHKISGIPVINGQNKLVGIITETNIFDAFIEIMGLRQGGFRLTVPVTEDRPGIMAEITRVISACDGNISHISTYDHADTKYIIFRIHRGNQEMISRALKEHGYESYVYLKK